MRSEKQEFSEEPGNRHQTEKTPQQTSRTRSVIAGIVFLGAIILRFGLALVNEQANDPHMPVIRQILREDELPEMADCWSCYHPKLFHYSIAKILLSQRLLETSDEDAQKLAAQLVNSLAGIMTLVAAWIYLEQAFPSADPTRKVLAFTLLAFNPQLIGINSQATNDTFVILFCTLAALFAILLLKQPNIWFFAALVICSSAAVASKTNGWVTVIAITIALFIAAWAQPAERATRLTFAFLYLLAVPLIAILNPLTQYRFNYERYGAPAVIPLPRQAAPGMFEKTFVPYAGILSIQDGFLTFKFFDLIRNPSTDLQEQVSASNHRTSLWTRLYGSGHSIHFENYPRTWRTSSPFVFLINRLIFILALIPTTLTLWGAVIEMYLTLKGILTRNLPLLQHVSFGLISLIFSGYMLFIALYAFQYRAYPFMKAIFIFPAALAFQALFLRGLDAKSFSPRTEAWFNRGLIIVVLLLASLYILDVSSLILQLLPNK